MGYKIIAISPDKLERLKRTQGKKKLTYTLLSDSGLEASKAFGIAFRLDKKKPKERMTIMVANKASGKDNNMLPVPSVFIVGTDRVIDFTYSNPDYTVRIQPEALLKAAKEAKEEK